MDGWMDGWMDEWNLNAFSKELTGRQNSIYR